LRSLFQIQQSKFGLFNLKKKKFFFLLFFYFFFHMQIHACDIFLSLFFSKSESKQREQMLLKTTITQHKENNRCLE